MIFSRVLEGFGGFSETLGDPAGHPQSSGRWRTGGDALHGLILAYGETPGLGELVWQRPVAILPFAGRYKPIDFALSALQNAGVRDVGVVMGHQFRALLDYLGSGKEWDLSRRRGGLRLLPPPDARGGASFRGTLEALRAAEDYIDGIEQKYVVLMRSGLVANIDLSALMKTHVETNADITALCSSIRPKDPHERFLHDVGGTATAMLHRSLSSRGVASLGVYLMSKDLLRRILSFTSGGLMFSLHQDALEPVIASGGRVSVHMHEGYAADIRDVEGFHKANMDMLDSEKRGKLFLPGRPVRTRERAGSSTYYGPDSRVQNCLLADGGYIEGALENCVVFRDVRIEKGASLKNCVIMEGVTVRAGSELSCVVSDEGAAVSPFLTLAGSPRLPLVIPKGSKI